jgi:hypothetical protein
MLIRKIQGNERKEKEMEENIPCTNDLPMLIIVATHVLRSKIKIETKAKKREMNIRYSRGRISPEWCVSACQAHASSSSGERSLNWICSISA